MSELLEELTCKILGEIVIHRLGWGLSKSAQGIVEKVDIFNKPGGIQERIR